MSKEWERKREAQLEMKARILGMDLSTLQERAAIVSNSIALTCPDVLSPPTRSPITEDLSYVEMAVAEGLRGQPPSTKPSPHRLKAEAVPH